MGAVSDQHSTQFPQDAFFMARYDERKIAIGLLKDNAPIIYASLKAKRVHEYNIKLEELRFLYKNSEDKEKIKLEAENIKKELQLYEG